MIGRTISHYKIIDQIGQGGMGVVYRAHDLRLDRSVALKFLSGETVDSSPGKQRFIREAQNAASLNHANICTIYEIDEADGLTFISMAFIDGQNIAQLIRSNRPDVARATTIAHQIADGLAAAHRQGIVHRDIKSANIIVSREGQTKILDFGLADARHRIAPTSSRRVTGTPSSMSPEQLRGDTVDQRSDIWSWGVVYYQMLTGRLPFPENELSTLTDAIFSKQPPKPSDLNPDVPEHIDYVVMKALEKDASRRFQNVAEIISFLDRASDTQDAEAQDLQLTVELSATHGRHSIAVLSFADMSQDKDHQYFCDGIAEEIINHLSHIPGLHVASRTSSFAFKEQSFDVREIGRQLGVETVLEGSVRKSGDDLRITCQLVGVANGYHLWSQRFDRTLCDVFAIQEEIAQKVAESLKIELSDSEKNSLGKIATRDIEAYDYYLRGREYFYSARHKTIQFALEMFQHAAEKDPRYSRAYAGIADCHSYLYMHFGGGQDDLRKALEASQKALEVDPDLAEGHASYGFALSLDQQSGEAEQEFKTAIALNPSLFEAYYLYARMCFAEGKLSEAAELFDTACRVCPTGYQAPLLLAMTYKTMGDSTKANETYADGLKQIESHLELHPDDSRAYYLASSALAELGEKEKALQFAERALAIDPDDAAIIYGMACLNAQLGNADRALDHLEQAIEAGFQHRDWIENDSDLAPIFSHPRFQQALANIG